MVRISAQQHVYTSSAKGHGGFQTVGAGRNLTPTQVRGLERLFVYPVDLGLRLENPPRIYRLLWLDQASLAFGCSEFVAKDFAGRPGSYLARTLVLNAAELEAARYDLGPLLRESHLFDASPDDSTAVMPDKEILLAEASRRMPDVPDWFRPAMADAAACLIEACNRRTGVAFVGRSDTEFLAIADLLIWMLPPWVRRVCTMSSFVPNPAAGSKNYRLMFCRAEYSPVAPDPADSRVAYFDLTRQVVPKAPLTSAWASLMSEFVAQGRWDRARELSDLHWRHGRRDPAGMAELLARLYRTEEEFGAGDNPAALAWFSTAMRIPNPESRRELPKEYLPRLFVTLIERKDPVILVQLLENIIGSRGELDEQFVKEYLPRLWTDSAFNMLVQTPDVWYKLLTCQLKLSATDERTRQSVFDAVASSVGIGDEADRNAVAEAVVASVRRGGPDMTPVMRALTEFVMSRYVSSPVGPEAVTTFLQKAGLLPVYLNSAVAIVAKAGLGTERYSEWMGDLLRSTQGEQRLRLAGEALSRFVESGEEDLRRFKLESLLAGFNWKDCEAVAKELELRYKGGKLLEAPGQRRFLALGRSPKEPSAPGKMVFNAIRQRLHEMAQAKRKEAKSARP